jgi:tripartite-type tricarboxylate transporter receptor subunit TctC
MPDPHAPSPPRCPFETPTPRRLRAFAFAFATAVALAPVVAHDVAAQDYPQRAVTLVNPVAAGGSNEAVKTIVFDRVAAALGVPIVMESRAGAGGAIGAAHVAKSAPDGYTLLLAGVSIMATNPATRKALPYDPVRDFTPIATLCESHLLLVTKSLPAKNAREFVALARAQPGKLNYGSYGPGTSNFLGFELFKQSTGIDVVHVPYRGSAPLLIALLAGEVESAFEYFPTLRPHVEKGTFRLLGIASDSRFPLLPDVPTLAEQGFPISAGGPLMLVAPAGLPAAIADRLNAEVNKVLALPEVRERLAEIGYAVIGGTREQAAKRVSADLAKWTTLVRDIGYTPE